MLAVTNISAYRFESLDNLEALREMLITRCHEWGLKGTILLSTEGINLFVAGGAAETQELLLYLRGVPGLDGLAAKVSESRNQPFRRMLIKIKKEIIAFGVEGISPARASAQTDSPRAQTVARRRPAAHAARRTERF